MNGNGLLSVASVILTERKVDIVSSIPAGSETTSPGRLWLLQVKNPFSVDLNQTGSTVEANQIIVESGTISSQHCSR